MVEHQRSQFGMAFQDRQGFAAFGTADIDDAAKPPPVEVGGEMVAGQSCDAVHGLGEQRIEIGVPGHVSIERLAVY